MEVDRLLPRSRSPYLFADVHPNVQHTPSGDGHGAPGFLKPGGVPAAVYTLSAMSLGVGVFVLPLVMTSIGLVAGLLAIAIFAVWALWMQMVLIEVAEQYSDPIVSYENLVERSLGQVGKFSSSFFTAITLLIGNAAHMKTAVIILHDLMEWYITGNYGLVEETKEKQLVLYVGLLSIAFGFCNVEEINALRFVSTASVMVVLTLCLWCTGECLFWYWPQGQHEFTGDNAIKMMSTDWKEYAENLPAVAFAFSSTFSLFPVYAELKPKTHDNVKKAVGFSTALCCFGYQIVSLIGVLTFGSGIMKDRRYPSRDASNYLYSFPPDHYGVSLLKFFLVVAMTLLYAVLNFPMLNAVEKMAEVLHIPALPLRRSRRRALVTLVGMGLVVALNLAFKSLVTLFGLCGGWGVAYIVYFIPSCVALANCRGRSMGYRGILVVSLSTVLAITGYVGGGLC